MCCSEVLIEKHWRKVTSRAVVDLFLEELNALDEPSDLPPVLATANLFLVSVYRDKLWLLCVVAHEVAPMLVVEFLHRVMDTLGAYLRVVHEGAIKENFSTVYQLLEDMCDYGIPMVTEPNALMEMVAPPSIQNRIKAAVSGRSSVADVLPDNAVSSIPWRRKGVSYSVNSIYFDIAEELRCVVGRSGQVVSCEVAGELQCRSQLSGMPDLQVAFQNPQVLQDNFSLHPCVRVARFQQDHVLSFVPPDGDFCLMSYTVDEGFFIAPGASAARTYPSLPIPVYCRPNISFGDGEANVGGTVDVMVGSKPLPGGRGKIDTRAAEDISLLLPFPKTVRSTDLKCNVGTVLCDEVSKVCRWSIGKVPRDTTPKLTGTFTLLPGAGVPDDTITLVLDFKVPDVSVSNLVISDISLFNETYEPYKYLRSSLRCKVQVRA